MARCFEQNLHGTASTVSKGSVHPASACLLDIGGAGLCSRRKVHLRIVFWLGFLEVFKLPCKGVTGCITVSRSSRCHCAPSSTTVNHFSTASLLAFVPSRFFYTVSSSSRGSLVDTWTFESSSCDECVSFPRWFLAIRAFHHTIASTFPPSFRLHAFTSCSWDCLANGPS